MHEPETVADAVSLLGQYGQEAALYAGGTELLLAMKEGLLRYSHLVNLKTVPGLDRLEYDQSAQELHIGPLHQVLLAVRDLDAAITFYRDTLGATLIASFDPPGMAFFDLGGGTRLYVSSTVEGEDDRGHQRTPAAWWWAGAG